MKANEVEELNKEYEAQLKEDLEEFEKERMCGIEIWRK